MKYNTNKKPFNTKDELRDAIRDYGDIYGRIYDNLNLIFRRYVYPNNGEYLSEMEKEFPYGDDNSNERRFGRSNSAGVSEYPVSKTRHRAAPSHQ